MTFRAPPCILLRHSPDHAAHFHIFGLSNGGLNSLGLWLVAMREKNIKISETECTERRRISYCAFVFPALCQEGNAVLSL